MPDDTNTSAAAAPTPIEPAPSTPLDALVNLPAPQHDYVEKSDQSGYTYRDQ